MLLKSFGERPQSKRAFANGSVMILTPKYPMSQEPLVSFRRLSRSFRAQRSFGGGQSLIQAVRDVSLDVAKGRTLGVVGESGCGKSTLGRMAVGLLEPTGGDVFIMGKPLYDKGAHGEYTAFRRSLAGLIQMIFQDPYSSLNPRMSIGESVAEPLICSSSFVTVEAPGVRQAEPGHGRDRAFIRQRVAEMLRQVGLGADAAGRYPHEFSGGQRQRIAIARALITSPAFVVCDEPTSSLDASVQSQVLNVLRDLQQALNLAYLFISHDLAVVRHMSDQVAVMYQGLLVESGDSEELFQNPLHPYTRLLLDSVPGIGLMEAGRTLGTDNSAGTKDSIPPSIGHKVLRNFDRTSAMDVCPFAPRCPHVSKRCLAALPALMATEGSLQSTRLAATEKQNTLIGSEEPGTPVENRSRLVRCFLYTKE